MIALGDCWVAEGLRNSFGAQLFWINSFFTDYLFHVPLPSVELHRGVVLELVQAFTWEGNQIESQPYKPSYHNLSSSFFVINAPIGIAIV